VPAVGGTRIAAATEAGRAHIGAGTERAHSATGAGMVGFMMEAGSCNRWYRTR
jgi:hypothetical protein